MNELLLLQEYWRLLKADADFQRDWRALCEQLHDYSMLAERRATQVEYERYCESLQQIEAFAARWRLPASIRSALEALLRRGETTLEQVWLTCGRFTHIAEIEPPIPDLSLPNPQAETRAEYRRRVKQQVHLERMSECEFVQSHRTLFGQEPSDAVMAWFRNRPRPWQEFLNRHYAPEYARLADLLRIAEVYYEQHAAALQTAGIPISRAKNRAKNPHYLRQAAEMVYLRVVKGWTWGQIAAKFQVKRETVRHSTKSAARALGIALESV